MSYTYRVSKRKYKTKGSQEEKEMYFARGVRGILISTTDLAQDIADRSALTRGDVYSAITTLSELMQQNLLAGNSVKIDDIGVFSLSLTSEGSEDPNELKARTIKVNKICFKADRKLSRKVKSMSFEKEKPAPKGYVKNSKDLQKEEESS